MNNQKILYNLLYYALIDIRQEAYLIDNKRIFGLCDFLHNLPLMLESRGKDEQGINDIMREIEQVAESDGYKKWLDNVKSQI